jgi:acyl-CoA thioesterase I
LKSPDTVGAAARGRVRMRSKAMDRRLPKAVADLRRLLRRRSAISLFTYSSIAVVFSVLIVNAIRGPAKAPLVRHRPPPLPGRSSADTDPVSYVPPPPKLTIRRPAGRPVRVLFIGDSVTGGDYASTEAHSFRRVVESRLERTSPVDEERPLRNPGCTPTYTRCFLSIPTDADVAIVELGTNDVGTTPVDRFAQDYARLVREIRQANPKLPLVCLSPWDPSHAVNIEDYEGVVRSDCTRPSVYVDITGIYDEPDSHAPKGTPSWNGAADGYHPGNLGHRRIAEAILRVLDVRG